MGGDRKNAMRLVKKIFSAFRVLKFVFLNAFFSLKVKKIEAVYCNDYKVSLLSSTNKKEALNIYKLYSSAGKLSIQNKLIWTLLGDKFCFVAENNKGKVIGVALYYINERDRKDGTVHACFSGVIKEARGKGVATRLRMCAIQHFEKNGFKGISSRVSLTNEKSLSVNLKLGFKPVETYFDEGMQEERQYLIKWF